MKNFFAYFTAEPPDFQKCARKKSERKNLKIKTSCTIRVQANVKLWIVIQICKSRLKSLIVQLGSIDIQCYGKEQIQFVETLILERILQVTK